MMAPVMAALSWQSAARAEAPLAGIAIPNILWESSSEVEDTLQSIKSAGFEAVRIGWKQPYAGAEAALLEATRNGLPVLVTIPLIDATVAEAGAQQRPATKGFFASYGLSQIDPNRLEDAAERLADFVSTQAVGLIGIEVGNEMNWSGYNGDLMIGKGRIISNLDQLDAEQEAAFLLGLDRYVEALERVEAVVYTYDWSTDVAVISGGLADINLDYIEHRGATLVEPSLVWRLLNERQAFRHLDGVGLHIYEPLRPGFEDDDREQMLTSFTDNCLSPLFGSLPCWITEFGMAIPAEDCAPDDLDRRERLDPLRAYLRSELGAQQVKATFFYDWSGDAAFSLERCGRPTALAQDLTSTSTLPTD